VKSLESNRTIKLAMWANGILGFVGVFIGIGTSNDAVIADAVHNLSDAGAHKAHELTEVSSKYKNQKVRLYTRLASLAIASGAVVVGANSASNLFEEQDSVTIDYASVGIEVTAIATNLALSRQYKRDKDTAVGHKHSMDHNRRDTYTSIGALGGVLLEPAIPIADSIAGIIISGVTLQLANKIAKDKEHTH
jgi:divalent metal cation (Fe/Co/Zn/Cd) transporter